MIAILGSNGMLGGMLAHQQIFLEGETWEVPSSALRIEPASKTDIFYQLDKAVAKKATHVVNCIGAIKPKFKNRDILADNIFVNGVFPHILADWGETRSVPVIHITTDCVFDGAEGKYTESSPHNPLDVYGKSKSIGEPSNCMVLRTSIIGPEWGGNKRSLVEWLLSNEGGEIKGFTNHLWNGMTTMELSEKIDNIISDGLYEHGTFHLFSEDINKYDLLKNMIDVWGLNIKIEPVEAAQACDRTMRTEKGLMDKLDCPVQSHEMQAHCLLNYVGVKH